MWVINNLSDKAKPIFFLSQFSSFVQSCPILCGPMDYSTPGFLVHYQLLESAQTHVHHVHPTVSSCYSLLLLPSIFSNIDVYFNEPVLSIRWPKSWSFSFSTSLSNEYSGLMSFRIDWFGCLDYSWPNCWVPQSSQVDPWNEPTDIAMENEYVKVLVMVISGWWTSGWISFSFKYFLNFFQKHMLVLK